MTSVEHSFFIPGWGTFSGYQVSVWLCHSSTEKIKWEQLKPKVCSAQYFCCCCPITCVDLRPQMHSAFLLASPPLATSKAYSAFLLLALPPKVHRRPRNTCHNYPGVNKPRNCCTCYDGQVIRLLEQHPRWCIHEVEKIWLHGPSLSCMGPVSAAWSQPSHRAHNS